MKIALKQLCETILKNSCPSKLMFLKKASVGKLYNGIHRYFAKQREIVLFYQIAENRIFNTVSVSRHTNTYACYHIPTVYSVHFESI